MFEVTNEVINKDGQALKDNATYAIHYTITNGTVDSVQCAVSTTDKNENFIQVGFIRKEGDRINTDFAESTSLLKHLTVFSEILKEIDADPDITK